MIFAEANFGFGINFELSPTSKFNDQIFIIKKSNKAVVLFS